MTPEPPPGDTGARPLWHGRFGAGPSDDLLAFTVSLPYDQQLASRRSRRLARRTSACSEASTS